MNRSELTVSNFEFVFVNQEQNIETYQDIVDNIKAGYPIKLHPMSESYTPDWKGLQAHKQILEIYNGNYWTQLYRVVYTPDSRPSKRIYSMCASDCE